MASSIFPAHIDPLILKEATTLAENISAQQSEIITATSAHQTIRTAMKDAMEQEGLEAQIDAMKTVLVDVRKLDHGTHIERAQFRDTEGEILYMLGDLHEKLGGTADQPPQQLQNQFYASVYFHQSAAMYQQASGIYEYFSVEYDDNHQPQTIDSLARVATDVSAEGAKSTARAQVLDEQFESRFMHTADSLNGLAEIYNFSYGDMLRQMPDINSRSDIMVERIHLLRDQFAQWVTVHYPTADALEEDFARFHQTVESSIQEGQHLAADPTVNVIYSSYLTASAVMSATARDQETVERWNDERETIRDRMLVAFGQEPWGAEEAPMHVQRIIVSGQNSQPQQWAKAEMLYGVLMDPNDVEGTTRQMLRAFGERTDDPQELRDALQFYRQHEIDVAERAIEQFSESPDKSMQAVADILKQNLDTMLLSYDKAIETVEIEVTQTKANVRILEETLGLPIGSHFPSEKFYLFKEGDDNAQQRLEDVLLAMEPAAAKAALEKLLHTRDSRIEGFAARVANKEETVKEVHIFTGRVYEQFLDSGLAAETSQGNVRKGEDLISGVPHTISEQCYIVDLSDPTSTRPMEDSLLQIMAGKTEGEAREFLDGFVRRVETMHVEEQAIVDRLRRERVQQRPVAEELLNQLETRIQENTQPQTSATIQHQQHTQNIQCCDDIVANAEHLTPNPTPINTNSSISNNRGFNNAN